MEEDLWVEDKTLVSSTHFARSLHYLLLLVTTVAPKEGMPSYPTCPMLQIFYEAQGCFSNQSNVTQRDASSWMNTTKLRQALWNGKNIHQSLVVRKNPIKQSSSQWGKSAPSPVFSIPLSMPGSVGNAPQADIQLKEQISESSSLCNACRPNSKSRASRQCLLCTTVFPSKSPYIISHDIRAGFLPSKAPKWSRIAKDGEKGTQRKGRSLQQLLLLLLPLTKANNQITARSKRLFHLQASRPA